MDSITRASSIPCNLFATVGFFRAREIIGSFYVRQKVVPQLPHNLIHGTARVWNRYDGHRLGEVRITRAADQQPVARGARLAMPGLGVDQSFRRAHQR
jgi:hypothetical protein